MFSKRFIKLFLSQLLLFRELIFEINTVYSLYRNIDNAFNNKAVNALYVNRTSYFLTILNREDSKMEKFSQLSARVLLGHIFLLAGLSKISAYEGTQGYMEAMGVPGSLLALVILLEIGGGLAIIVGWQTRWTSYALAAFSVASAVIFHSDFGDQTQMVMFMKNFAIAGGFLLLSVHGAGAYSLDSRSSNASLAANHS
jgi:putative oxidoreductase